MVSIKGIKEAPVEDIKDTLAALDSILQVDGCEAPKFFSRQFTGSSSWNDAYTGLIVPIIEDGTSVGVNLADLSRIISYDQIEDAEEREKIKKHITSSVPPVIWQNSVGAASASVSPHAVRGALNNTSIHSFIKRDLLTLL